MSKRLRYHKKIYRLIPSLETFMNNKYLFMISSSFEERQFTLSSLSLTQIMYNTIYEQIERSEEKKTITSDSSKSDICMINCHIFHKMFRTRGQ